MILARGQTWQSALNAQNVVRLRSPYPNDQWRGELRDGTTVFIDAAKLQRLFTLVGAADGK